MHAHTLYSDQTDNSNLYISYTVLIALFNVLLQKSVKLNY